MSIKKLFARKARRTPAERYVPCNVEVALNPIALLVKGATRI